MSQGAHARAARLVKQHAQTARLLGVDFMPRYQAFESRAPHEAGGSSLDARSPDVPLMDVPKARGGDARDNAGRLSLRRGEEVARHAPEPPASASVSASAPMLPSAQVEMKAQRTGVKVAAASAGFVPSAAPAPKAKPTDRSDATTRLDALRARYEADAPHRQFVTSFNNIVFGDGDPCARLVFVGEAPGEEEDKTGTPFVGRAGQLLNKMIAAMGTSREEVYICNVLKTRPPNNATPTSFEANLCKPYLLEQLGILHPEVIVTLGLPATHTLLNVTDSMARLRGKWASLTLPNGLVVPVMPTYHPAFLLRSYNAENRGKVWADLLMVVEKLGLTPSRKAQNEGE